jgi:single-strand DNA-binding protein
MSSFNKILLMGHLTRDPQLSYTPNQTAVVDFGIATNRKFKKQDGSTGKEVCFVNCTSFGKSAETLNKYVSKGSPLFIEGRLKFDSWTAQDGTKRNKLNVIVEAFQFLPSGNNQSQSQDGGANPEYDEEYQPPNDAIPF